MNRIVKKAARGAYNELIADRQQQIPFWILIGFLPTFVTARFLVYYYPHLFLHVHGAHVHHFAYGIVVLAVVGFTSLVWAKNPYRRLMAAAYGVGLSLAFDEFGIWLTLTANYNLDQSEDVMVGILVFLVVIVYFIGVIRRTTYLLKRSVKRK